MAKKLLNANYTFDASTKKITVPGYVKAEDFLLITDITNNKIIYNFSDPARSLDSASFNEITENTTITLSADLVTLGCSDSDNLQIFVDKPQNEMDFHETYIDPVHKLRVSQPENLIDTDFEYGLQPTKWETLERSNNMPSFYVPEGDLSLTSVTRVEALAGSSIISVVTSENTGITAGTPVDVQGLISRTAEGKYLITTADSFGFTYQASGPQSITGEIGSLYTTITPGTFYTGSGINYNVTTGLATDDKTVDSGGSTITITTSDDHGFKDGSNFYLVNTIGQTSTILSDSSEASAPDGRPYVDDSDTISRSIPLDLTLTNTPQIRARHHRKFSSSDVDTSANTIYWPSHGMRANDVLLYMAPSGDTVIGGLTNFQTYLVKVTDANNIQLTTTQSGTAINFSSAGTSNYGRHSLHLVYEIYRVYQPVRQYTAYWYHRADQTGSGSGWDRQTYGTNGLGSGSVSRWFPFSQSSPNYYITDTSNLASSQIDRWYAPTYNGNFQLGTTNNPPNQYNFVEDWTRFSTGNYLSNSSTAYFQSSKSYYRRSQFDTYPNSSNIQASEKVFVFPVVLDEEADTFYAQNHGLTTGNALNWTTSAGTAPYIHSGSTSYNNSTALTTLSDGDYSVERVTDDRFKLQGKRISMANGTYSLNAIVSNDTRNSFYIADHGFNQNSDITFSLGSGAVIPTSNSGQILPIYTTSSQTSTLPNYYSVLSNAIDTYISDNSISTNNLVFSNSHSGSSVQVFSSAVSSGNSPINSFNLQYTTHSGYNSAIGSFSIPSSNLYVSNFSPETPYNVWTGTSGDNGGRGFNMVATKWERNTSVSKYLWVGGLNRASSSEYGYHHFLAGASMTSSGSFNYYANVQQNGSYNATSGNNYRYAWAGFAHYFNSLRFIYLQVKFRNYSDWESYNTNSYLDYVSNGDTYWYIGETTSSSYYQKDDLQFGLCLIQPQSDTNLDTSSEITTFVQNILETFDQNAVYTPLTNNANYKVNVISNDRFSLSSTGGNALNITSKGTTPFEFGTPNVLGILDGAYRADSASADTIKFKRPTQRIGGQRVNTSGTTTDNRLAVSAGTHSLASGTAVVYSTDSDSAAISGLTNGGTYYVSVIDDQNFKLSTSTDDAIGGTGIITIGNTLDSAAIHSFSTPAISGITLAPGTVDITSGEAEIVGTETLFKRYFKPGDNIHLKDNTTTPGRILIFKVTTVPSDTHLTLTPIPDFTATDTDHFVETKVYAKPDGYAVHRPFDGGVEIAAGNAPGSQITRQTRKYFRYQSGKGIQTSLAINFNPPVTLDTLTGDSDTATATTKYPHRLTNGQAIEIKDASDSNYNGIFSVTTIDDFTFRYTTDNRVLTTSPDGIIKYNVRGYNDAYTRAGMFDDQNGFFFEFDGNNLNCVRRSSVEQLSGTVNVVNNRGLITGVNTRFIGQLQVGDYVVLRGQSHKVVSITSNTEMDVTPQYKGTSANGVIMTKTVDVKVPQSEWNIDKCDGSGPEGFVLDIDKIQMAYMDYSWYGAGKVRFGFKDREGHVRYVHHFIHNNRLDEAYMRSGNLPAKYEILNGNNPSYTPTLFHWGTSVIMDGTFDDDKAYLFTAQGNSLTFTNGDTETATTTGTSALVNYDVSGSRYLRDYYVRIPFAVADASKFYAGLKLFGTGLNGEEVSFTNISGSTVYVYLYVGRYYRFSPPSSYPVVSSGTAVTLGIAAGSDDVVDLGTTTIPLVSLRLAPSVDGNITGALGQRDIINRMQLQLKETGLILTHDCEVKLILNGNLSNVTWVQVANPSLSELIQHEVGDTIDGGTEVFSFRASGGTTDASGTRLSNTSDFDLTDIIDLGNSILGGDGVFPNGPDVLTVAVRVVDTNSIDANNPFKTSSRITWSESQA